MGKVDRHSKLFCYLSVLGMFMTIVHGHGTAHVQRRALKPLYDDALRFITRAVADTTDLHQSTDALHYGIQTNEAFFGYN